MQSFYDTMWDESEVDLPIFTNGERACLFVHIPKTGGSSVEASLTKSGWTKHLSINGISPERLSFLRATPQHFHAEILDQFINYDDLDEIVAVVRDPVMRMKSEFYWQEQWRHRKLPVERWIAEMFEALEQDRFAFDNHLRPQSDFIPSTDKIRIFKLEDDGVSKAIEILDLASPKRDATRFNFHGFRKQGNAKSSEYRDEVEAAFAEQATRIREFYHRDCELFGYSK